jgi:RecA-family ATPase
MADEPTAAEAAEVEAIADLRAQLDAEMQLERWDPTAKVKHDPELLPELVSARFIEAHRDVTIVGPVGGVGKTFLAHALAFGDGIDSPADLPAGSQRCRSRTITSR